MDRVCSTTPARHRVGTSDAELIDEALAALLRRGFAAEIDAVYASAYAAHPIDEPDEWVTLSHLARSGDD